MRNIIAVDIGNTETTVGIGSKDNWDSYRFTTRDTNTTEQIIAPSISFLTSLLIWKVELKRANNSSGVFVSLVVNL